MSFNQPHFQFQRCGGREISKHRVEILLKPTKYVMERRVNAYYMVMTNISK